MNELFDSTYRPRRLRASAPLRHLVRETRVSPESLVWPLFTVEEPGVKREIPSLPGQYHWAPDRICEAVEQALAAGVDKFLLFGLPARKDERGSGAWVAEGVVQQALRAIRERYPEVLLIGDVCLCEYTSHGHCGVLDAAGQPDNDRTLPLLAATAVSQVQAGADMVAPSAMMDGQIGALRKGLDEMGFDGVPIMAYSAKYASAFYGPFRDAAGSAPAKGDRKGYQMDPHNVREAVRESLLDAQQGADILMVKPALAYLDVIARVKQATDLPLAAYSVSGEYAMLKAAAAAGFVDEHAVMCEMATGIFRAGADVLITYSALELAEAMRQGDVG